MAPTCSGMVPNHLWWFGSGPLLGLTSGTDSFYYRFEGATDRAMPIHDPCGTGNSSHHKKGAADPGGQIYLR